MGRGSAGMIGSLWQAKWGLLRLGVAVFVLWALLAGMEGRLARLQVMSLRGLDYAAEGRHLREARRYGEALVVAEAGAAALRPWDEEYGVLMEERRRTEEERGSILRRVGAVGLGALSGEGDSVEGLVGAVAADFFVVGDVRDLVIQGGKLAVDGEADEVILALSGVGLATTLAPQVDWAPSLLKAARKMGTLTKGLSDWLVAAVKRGRVGEVSRLLDDVGVLARRGSPGGAVRALAHAESAADVAMLARFVERNPRGAFALHVTGKEGADLVKAGGSGVDEVVVLAAGKGRAGTAWLRGGKGVRALARPHPLVGVMKGVWKGHAGELVERLVGALGPRVWWMAPLAAAWVLVECGVLMKRWSGRRGGGRRDVPLTGRGALR